MSGPGPAQLQAAGRVTAVAEYLFLSLKSAACSPLNTVELKHSFKLLVVCTKHTIFLKGQVILSLKKEITTLTKTTTKNPPGIEMRLFLHSPASYHNTPPAAKLETLNKKVLSRDQQIA